ncbi:MAG: CopG family transcriptional regulator [Desulfurococcus sp.]|nr:CopG family transcriptional regulator [Desulfurococcus sp.]
MSSEGSKREIRILVDEALYRELEKRAISEGFSDVSSYILSLITARIPLEKPSLDSFERLRARLERFIQDEINKSLASIEVLRRQVTDLTQRVEELEDRIKSIEGREAVEAVEAAVEKAGRPRKPGKTGMERLREDKVLFESSLPPRIQRDRLFSYFERMGAVILHLSRERIAVDPEYWREFKEKLFNEVKSSSEEELKRILGDKGFALWKNLYEDGMIVYDSKTRSWKPASGELRDK